MFLKGVLRVPKYRDGRVDYADLSVRSTIIRKCHYEYSFRSRPRRSVMFK